MSNLLLTKVLMRDIIEESLYLGVIEGYDREKGA